MPDSEHALLKQAFQHAENCLTEANAIVDYLEQAITDLQEKELELREAVTQLFIKTDQFIVSRLTPNKHSSKLYSQTRNPLMMGLFCSTYWTM